MTRGFISLHNWRVTFLYVFLYLFLFTDCKATSDLMYGGTVALGCDPFLKAQENACTCRQSQINSDKKFKKKVDPTKKATSSESVKNDKKDRTKSGRRNDEL